MAPPGDRVSNALGQHGYRQIKKVGEGSFGAAILVQEQNGDSKMICKMIDISRATKQERNDAVKESRVLSLLKHPYIVKYRETFHEDGWLCIVMDYCEGGDLTAKIKRAKQAGKTFPESQVIRWFTQAVLALQYIHDMHILHRDLKSGNFFLSKTGNIKMGDFGIAKVLECTAACAQTQIGTPYYLSPEICKGKPYAWSADIWSMGCILHELCARQVPFDAPDLKRLIEKITKGSAPDLPSEYSQPLRSLVRELLDHDPSKRPQAGEILKRPVIQDMVRKMLDQVQEGPHGHSEPSSDVPPADSVSASQPEPVASQPEPGSAASFAGSYVRNQLVEFWSETHGEWLPAQVTHVSADGRVMINVKPSVWLGIEVQAERMRPRPNGNRGSGASSPEVPTAARVPSNRGRPSAQHDPSPVRRSSESRDRRPPISKQPSLDRMLPAGRPSREPTPRQEPRRNPNQDRITAAAGRVAPGRQPSPVPRIP